MPRIMSGIITSMENFHRNKDLKTESFTTEGKEATLYLSEDKDSPLIVFNNFEGDGRDVLEEIQKTGKREFNLLSVGNLEWDHDMTPWYSDLLSPQESPGTGGAGEYLKLLVEGILPEAVERIQGKPSYIGLAGYSLAGLFALYALYHTDVFQRAASMSGSLWYPDFKQYALTHPLRIKPERLYISLGDKEAKTKHPLLKTVQENTEELVDFYRKAGIDVTWELNPGNHFKNAVQRSAKGIAALI